MKQHMSGPAWMQVDALMALVALLLVFPILIMPPVPIKTSGDIPICSLAIDIEWADNTDTDVDLWARAGNERPVGYSARDGSHLDLVRDDLGRIREGDGPNNERVCGRGFIDGEYIVNVHLFRLPVGENLPIPVNVSVKLVNPSTAFMHEIWKGAVELTYVGQELTAIRFRLKDGELVTGSVNDIPVGLRTAVK